MTVKDYYKILQFNSNRVNTEQIKSQYKLLAKKYHPDVNVGNKKAEERFKDIGEAYRILTDTSARKKYDKLWTAHVGKKTSTSTKVEANENTFFSILFGPGFEEQIRNKSKVKKVMEKGENIDTEINISIKDAYLGMDKKIVLRDIENKDKVLIIKIPQGLSSGHKIKVTGEGKDGKNGGKNGDLFIKVNILDDENFKLNGLNIETELLLSPWEAALGCKVNVDGIQEITTIYIPAGTQSGDSIAIKNKGYSNKEGQVGDLIVKTKIVIPKNITKEEKEYFQKLEIISKFNPRNNKK